MDIYRSILLGSLGTTALAVMVTRVEVNPEKIQPSVSVSHQWFVPVLAEDSPPPGCDRTELPDCDLKRDALTEAALSIPVHS